MFTIRPYNDNDSYECGICLYEGFFKGPINDNDKLFLQDYALILIEKCNFSYVALNEDNEVVGFIAGKYNKRFNKKLSKSYDNKRHIKQWIKMFIYFYFKKYKLSDSFKKEFDNFFYQIRQRDSKKFGYCDLELVVITSKKDYRKGLGTLLLNQFINRAKQDNANIIRLFTNTYASYLFYEKRGFNKVIEYEFKNDPNNKSIVYEYIINQNQ